MSLTTHSPDSTQLLCQGLSKLSTEKLLIARQMATEALEWQRENVACRFFEPNGAQQKFVDLIGRRSPLIPGTFSAANGVGKTATVANVLANIIWGPQNRFFDYPVFKLWPYPKRLRFVTDPNLLGEDGPLHTEIRRWWPRRAWVAAKSGKTYFSLYRANGFLLEAMSYEQALKEFEGKTLGAVLFDEPPVRSIYNACITRLRKGGIALVFMTPLTGAAWYFDDVIPRHEHDVVYGDIEENCREHGIRGQLEHTDIERIVAEMDPTEIEARAHGKAMYLQGLVYKNFDPAVHILDQKITPPPGAQVWQIVDPHGDKPFAVIWGFCDRSGSLFQVDEWPNEDFYRMHGCNLGIPEYKRIFAQKEQGWNVTKRIMDRHFAEVRTVHTRKTLREEFAAAGLNYDLSYHGGVEEVHVGIVKVRGLLAYDASKPVDGLNRPHYYVNPHCTNTIKGWQRWSVDPKTGDYQDEFKDFMDTVRYWAMANPRHSEPAPYQEPRRLFG